MYDKKTRILVIIGIILVSGVGIWLRIQFDRWYIGKIAREAVQEAPNAED